MGPSAWRVPGSDPADVVDAPPTPVASLQYLRAALRRRWRFWVGLALVGLVLGLAYPVLRPPPSTGTTTLVLAHQPGADPAAAMATDVSFLRTRTVASRVIERLGLDMSPEELEAAIVAEPVTSDVLAVRVSAEADEIALERVRAVSDVYLEFRSEQVRAESEALTDGNEERLAVLEQDAARLTRQYDALTAAGSTGQDRAGDVLTERSQVYSEIDELQRMNEASELEASTVITATHVLDEPSIVPTSPVTSGALTALSGLIGGAGLGAGLVLFQAMTSTRLRTRNEIALALGAPVRYSVGPIRGPGAWLRRLRGGSWEANLDVLCHGVADACGARGDGVVRLAVGTLDNARDVEMVVGTVGARLSLAGRSVLLVDLSDRGRLEQAVSRALAQEGRPGVPAAAPTVFRPEGVPSLTQGPLAVGSSASAVFAEDASARAAWDAAEVVLTLAEVEPSVGVEDVATWAERMVLVVTAGRSSVERLRTTGELVRSAGLLLPFALLVRADRSDESLGTPELADEQATEARTAAR